jgi:hypothetical protein
MWIKNLGFLEMEIGFLETSIARKAIYFLNDSFDTTVEFLTQYEIYKTIYV